MIKSLIIGNKNEALNIEKWCLIQSNGNDLFFGNDAIRQRIRLGKGVAVDEEDFKSIRVKDIGEDIHITDYSTPYGFWVNNNKNMNPTWITSNRPYQVEQVAIYVSFLQNYKLLKYNLNEETKILQTYNKRGEGVRGCTIVTTDKNLLINSILLTAYVKDSISNTYLKFVIESVDGDIKVKKEMVRAKSRMGSTLKFIDMKFSNSLGFKIHPGTDEMLTSTYLVSESQYEIINELTKDIKNRNIVIVPEGITPEQFDAILENDAKILSNNIRAITVSGVDIPLDICKKYKLIYVFQWLEKDTEKLKCIKSN